jgi:glutamate racemase
MPASDSPQAGAAGDDRPIGVFDSGVGGLSVLRAIHDELPAEDLIYVADSAFAPYGDRSVEFIEARARAVVDFLVGLDVKALVVACNTATGVAVHVLRARYSMPIVAMEPAIKPAVAQTKTGVVGVLATTRTLSSPKFQRLIELHGRHARVLTRAGTGLALQVERGEFDSPRTRALVEDHVRPLVEQGADTLVLGCTHYPFLRSVIEDVAGPGVRLIDPAVPVSRELCRRLDVAGLRSRHDRNGHARFFSSAPGAQAETIIGQLWAEDVQVEPLLVGPAQLRS